MSQLIEKNKIDKLLKEKKDLYQKVSCVYFDGISEQIVNDSSRLSFQDFFGDLYLQEINTDSDLKTYVDNISALLGNEAKRCDTVVRLSTVSMPNNIANVTFEDHSSDVQELFRLIQSIKESRIAHYNTEEGQLMPNDSEYATVRVYERVLECDQNSIILFDFDRLSSLEELRTHINNVLKTGDSDSVKIQSKLKFLKYAVLPTIYDHEMIHGLFTLATCDNLDLQKHAHDFAERLLLKEKLDSSYSGISLLVKLKTMLIESIEFMSQDKTFDPNKRELIKRKCLLLYWVHLDIVLQATRQEDLGDVNLKLSRSQEQKEPIKMFFSTTNTFLSLSFEEARKFQKDVLPWNDQNETITARQKECKQFYIIVDLMKQMFKIQNSGDRILHCLKNLESYLLTKTGIWRQYVSPLCTELIKQGTLQLLTYISNLEERCLKQNITAICQKALDILRICKRNGTLEITRTLRSLVFSPKKELRSLALQFFDGKNEFHKSIELLFLEEVQEYFPALRIHHKLTPRTDHINYWLNISGKFMKSKFRASVYIPSKENLITSNRTKFADKKDSLKERHIQTLCRLHHPNIVTLHAFNINCIPEFYIQEQSSEENSKNLQQYLVNKSQNINNVCTKEKLIQFLLDAAAAVKYCHDKDIILRDITAASFIVVNKTSVKLSKFKLSIHLAGKTQIKQNNVDYNQVPTRWSAPESLLRLIWSKLSDVWMFGMLMFEVLTHGVLPFSHVKLKDEDWLRHFSRSSIKVKHEDCLSLAQYEVILQCTDYDTTKRPTISELEESLERQLQHERSTEYLTQYPDLNSQGYKPSTQHRKGIPKSSLTEEPYQFYRSLSTDLKEYTISDKTKHLFRQKSRRRPPEVLIEKISFGLLTAVLPSIDITNVKKTGDIFIFDVTVHRQLDGNVLEMVLNKRLGKSSRDFKQLLLKIALLIDSLHKLKVVLGSIRASQLFVHRITEADFKIYPVSLAYLHYLEAEQSLHKPIAPPLDHPVLVVRSAPEVKKKNMLSIKSDVFQWAVVALDLSGARETKYNPGGASSTTDTLNFDTLEKTFDLANLQKPKGMKEKLFQLVQKCLSKRRNQRPSMEEIIKMLSSEHEKARIIDNVTYDSNTSASFNASFALNVVNESYDLADDDHDSLLSSDSSTDTYESVSDPGFGSVNGGTCDTSEHVEDGGDSGFNETKVKVIATEDETSMRYVEIRNNYNHSNMDNVSSQHTRYENDENSCTGNEGPEDSEPQIGISRCPSLPNPAHTRRSQIMRPHQYPVSVAYSFLGYQLDSADYAAFQPKINFNYMNHLCKEDHYDTAYDLYTMHINNNVQISRNEHDALYY